MPWSCERGLEDLQAGAGTRVSSGYQGTPRQGPGVTARRVRAQRSGPDGATESDPKRCEPRWDLPVGLFPEVLTDVNKLDRERRRTST